MGIYDDFHKSLVKKWAIQTIAVLYNSDENPIATQGLLVLQGEQGIGKTQLFRHLAIKEQFFKGGAVLDMRNKDTLMSATKVWICELGELDCTTKKEQSAVKAFLTEQTDRFREPYARNEIVRPRRTSFCGTVNPKAFLCDETGNRRYWTISVDKIDIRKIFEYDSEWYAQFWRQIHAEYINNPKGYLLTKDEQDIVNRSNEQFETLLSGEDEFITMFDTETEQSKWQPLTAAQIADLLNEQFHGLNISSVNVGKQLIPRIEKRIGIVFKRTKTNGKRVIYCPPYRIK
jgi:predicted P-loop ATPase